MNLQSDGGEDDIPFPGSQLSTDEVRTSSEEDTSPSEDSAPKRNGTATLPLVRVFTPPSKLQGTQEVFKAEGEPEVLG